MNEWVERIFPIGRARNSQIPGTPPHPTFFFLFFLVSQLKRVVYLLPFGSFSLRGHFPKYMRRGVRLAPACSGVSRVFISSGKFMCLVPWSVETVLTAFKGL